MIKSLSSLFIFAALMPMGRSSAQPDQLVAYRAGLAEIQTANLRIEFDKNMRSRVIARFGGKDIPMGGFSASETVKGTERSWDDFSIVSQTHERITGSYGTGEKLTLAGPSGVLRKNLSVIIYDEFPNLAIFLVSYTNAGHSPLKILEWNNNSYRIDAQRSPTDIPFWSFQSGSYERRPNWIVPLKTGFSQQNYLGMNASDYGGGTPIVDVWRKDAGIGVGPVEPRPRRISLPVSRPNARQAEVSVRYHHEQSLPPGESLRTFRTFVTVHNGDYFQTLLTYRRFMLKQGFQMANAPESAFGAIWCAWGYGRGLKPQQAYDTPPPRKPTGITLVLPGRRTYNRFGL